MKPTSFLALGAALLLSSCANPAKAPQGAPSPVATAEAAAPRKKPARYVYDPMSRTYEWVEDDLRVTSPYQ